MPTAKCRDVQKLSRGGLCTEEFESTVVRHLEEMEKKVSSLREELPESAEKKSIMQEFETVAMSQLPRRLELVRVLARTSA